MQLLVDYIPIIIFFGAYFYKGIYFATAVLMAVMPVMLAGHWFMTKTVNRIYLFSTILVLILGGLTILLRNPLFLFWKPTVLYWLMALVLIGSMWIGSKPVIERLMGNSIRLEPGQWRTLNLMWSSYFVIAGAANIYVAYNYPEAFWVQFKLFGMLGMTVVFVIIQTAWLMAVTKGQDTTPEDAE